MSMSFSAKRCAYSDMPSFSSQSAILHRPPRAGLGQPTGPPNYSRRHVVAARHAGGIDNGMVPPCSSPDAVEAGSRPAALITIFFHRCQAHSFRHGSLTSHRRRPRHVRIAPTAVEGFVTANG